MYYLIVIYDLPTHMRGDEVTASDKIAVLESGPYAQWVVRITKDVGA